MFKEGLKQEAVVAQVERRREVWRDKEMENKGSLVNRVMNGQVARKRCRGMLRRDGWSNFVDCIASLDYIIILYSTSTMYV